MINLIATKFDLKTSTSEGTEYSISNLSPLYYDGSFDVVFGKNSLVIYSTQLVDQTCECDPKCSIWRYTPSVYAKLIKTIAENCLDADQDEILS